MADAVFSFGGVVFGLTDACLVSLRRRRLWRWASQEVLDVAPRRAFIGPGETSIDLDGVVVPGQLGAADAPARLEALGDLGEPHALVDSGGRAYGRWTIDEITQAQSAFFAYGTPRRIEWTMRLTLYPEDSDG